MYSEEKLIKRVIAALPSEKVISSRGCGLRLGNGDDAAVFHPAGARNDWVFSCDAFLEGVHFYPRVGLADSAGFKSLVRATSDLAAMGASPRFFFLTLALPASKTGFWLDKFLRGMAKAARQLDMRLLGGDTTRFARVAASLTVVGEIQAGRSVTRAGARPGDLIYVSGSLGRAQLGLELFERHLGALPQYRHLLQPHLYPRIKLELGAWLARHRVASAMMDISDGLSTDLHHLCMASSVGARLLEARIPSVRIPRAVALSRLKLNPLQLALHGGEDYELLFTVPERKKLQLRKAPGFEYLAEIGEITRDKRILLGKDSAGPWRRLEPRGWDPFRNR